MWSYLLHDIVCLFRSELGEVVVGERAAQALSPRNSLFTEGVSLTHLSKERFDFSRSLARKAGIVLPSTLSELNTPRMFDSRKRVIKIMLRSMVRDAQRSEIMFVVLSLVGAECYGDRDRLLLPLLLGLN